MTEIERLLDQLQRAHEGEAWHGPALKQILADVTAAQAARRPLPSSHTIWELVLHISAWESAVATRLGGRYVDEPDEGDFPAVTDTTEAAWQETLARLDATHHKLRDAVRNFDPERLTARLAEGKQTAYFAINGVIQHTLYHAGQIVLLKKA
ncbi:MAG TPA: DinB family protein [Blastocatellia bacterium]|nr:DinB family protein [Blastocatellia bacterium]